MENKKAYIIYESNCVELQCDGCNITDIIGLTDKKEKAIQLILERINIAIKNGYKLDEQNKEIIENIEAEIDKDVYLTMFWQEQENWNKYYEINCELIDFE